MLHEVAQYVARGDIVIDGSNNSYVESDNHAQFFAEKGIRFLGIGVSGGIIALRDGYPLMVGGDASAYQQVTPILESLAKPHGGQQHRFTVEEFQRRFKKTFGEFPTVR
jgi:6-phosphogluconate dehydrogenase